MEFFDPKEEERKSKLRQRILSAVLAGGVGSTGVSVLSGTMPAAFEAGESHVSNMEKTMRIAEQRKTRIAPNESQKTDIPVFITTIGAAAKGVSASVENADNLPRKAGAVIGVVGGLGAGTVGAVTKILEKSESSEGRSR